MNIPLNIFFFLTTTLASISWEEYEIEPVYFWRLGLEIGVVIAVIIILTVFWRRQTRRIEERFQGLTEYGTDITLACKQEGSIVYQSPSLTSILGYEPGELLGTSVVDLFHEADRANWEGVLAAILNGKSPQTLKYRIRHKQGHYLDVESNCVNMLDNNALQAIVLNARDMTRYSQTQQELQQVKKVAETANQMKRDFLFKMSHELRTPLNAILGYTQLLRKDKGLMDKQHEAIETIHRSSEHLLRLLNRLSDLSRIETQEIEEQDSELKALAEEVCSEIDQKNSHRRANTYSESNMSGFKISSLGSGRKILVVDDNDQNRAFVKDILSPLGFEVMEAVNGREALNTVKDFHPNVILMDLVMPGMDGFETIRRIRRIPEFEEVVVIGISASAYDVTKQESFAAGCNDFLTKPFQIEEILDCLRVHLGLEWICEETPEMNSEDIQAAEVISLVAPPQEVLRELLGFAKGGCITDIRDSVANMKELDPNLIPFANRIEQLTDNFQFDQIIENIRMYMEVRK